MHLLSRFHFFVPLFIFFISCKQEAKPQPQAKRQVDAEQVLSAEELENKGFLLFKQNPVDALPYFEQAAEKYLAKNQKSKAAIAYSNVAGVYDKNLNENAGALEYATKSLNLWRSIGKKLQIANQLKDLGLYEARAGNITGGITLLEEAIGHFQAKNAKNGIAECKFNLAQISFMEKKYEESEKYYLESNEMWLKTGMKTKAFTNNLFGMRLYNAMGDTDKLKSTLDHTKKLQDQIKMRPHFEQALAKTLREIGPTQ